MKRYEEYKDSGIEWIGDVPNNWDVKKIKYISTMKSGNSITSERIEDDGGYPVYGGNGLRGYTQEYTHDGEYILIGRQGALCGNVRKVSGKFWPSEHAVVVYDNNLVDKGWFKYFLENMNLNQYSTSAAQPGLSVEQIANLYACVPPHKTQEVISSFLDMRTMAIDALIADKQALITLLKEKRQAIISEAVTKGLDRNAKMKDSGVEWIGEIPEGWGVTKIKFNTYVKGRIGWQGLKSDEFIDEGAFLVTGTDIIDGLVNWETCYHISDERYAEAPQIQLKNGDLIITKDGTIGKVAVISDMPDRAILNSGLFVIRPVNGYLQNYMYWVLNSKCFQEYVGYMESGSTIKHLYQETFENFDYPLPSLSEQLEIIMYINERIERIDQLISNVYVQIEKLKEYRQSIISEAVTGKVAI